VSAFVTGRFDDTDVVHLKSSDSVPASRGWATFPDSDSEEKAQSDKQPARIDINGFPDGLEELATHNDNSTWISDYTYNAIAIPGLLNSQGVSVQSDRQSTQTEDLLLEPADGIPVPFRYAPGNDATEAAGEGDV
jgi:hypothetical protein